MEEFSPGMGLKPREVQRQDLQPEWREPSIPSLLSKLFLINTIFIQILRCGRDHLIAALGDESRSN